jgi:hypothetical protein
MKSSFIHAHAVLALVLAATGSAASLTEDRPAPATSAVPSCPV